MPKSIAPLTDIQVRTAKPQDKSYKLSDGAGMYLEVMPTGAKLWRMKVRQANGRESRLSFCVYPDVSLRVARAERGKVKQQQAQGIDPAQQKRIDKQRKRIAAANTFELIAREWHANKGETWKENTAREAINCLQNDVFPHIGKYPIAALDAPLLLDVLRQGRKTGRGGHGGPPGPAVQPDFSLRHRQGVIKYNPVPDLRGALRPRAKGGAPCRHRHR